MVRGKTKKATRRLKVPPVLRPFLLELARAKRPEDPLFGPKANRHAILGWVKRIAELAGVKLPDVKAGVTTHSLRRTNSTMREERGDSEDEIKQQMGWESITTGYRHYIHPSSREDMQGRRVEQHLRVDEMGEMVAALEQQIEQQAA